MVKLKYGSHTLRVLSNYMKTQSTSGPIWHSCRWISTKAKTQQHAFPERFISKNPMLNGVSMLQWFFDEVRPDQREVRYWMNHFAQTTNVENTFAVIQITESVFLQEALDQAKKRGGEKKRSILETLSLSLYFLQQNRMKVMLLVGTTEPSSNSQQRRVDRNKISENIQTVVDRLTESGTSAFPLFDAGRIFQSNSTFSNIETVNTDTVDWLLTHSSIPVMGCVAESDNGTLGAVNLDDGLFHLSAYTQPLKVLQLNAEGGVIDHTGQRLTTVFLPRKTELSRFVDQPWWSTTTEMRFTRVCDLLKVLPKRSSYVITSADSLLTELLTQRGVGTMFKKVAPVARYTSLDDVIETSSEECTCTTVKHVLPDLVHRCFGRSTTTSYWDTLPDKLDAVYLTDDLKSCAIVQRFPSLDNVFYLDKFAVSKEDRGNFNTDVLWQQLTSDYKSLFWRSRRDNVFNRWYETRSDGIIKIGYYHVFWQVSDLTELIRRSNREKGSLSSRVWAPAQVRKTLTAFFLGITSSNQVFQIRYGMTPSDLDCIVGVCKTMPDSFLEFN